MPYSRMTAINYRPDGYQERFAAQFTKPMRRHPEWRYYKDGKSWLCKITQKNKTIVWISLWEPFLNHVSILQKKAEVDLRV